MHSDEYYRQREDLLCSMPKYSVCAEIGVHLGDFSRKILDFVTPKKLYLIDPWVYLDDKVYEDAIYGGEKGNNQAVMDTRYNNVVKRFQSEIEKGQVEIHRSFSFEICSEFKDNYFDWIYLDGNHLYEFTKRDLGLYYSKVKEGGFISGDDYVDGGWWKGGAKKAVDEFIVEASVQVVLLENEQFKLKKICP